MEFKNILDSDDESIIEDYNTSEMASDIDSLISNMSNSVDKVRYPIGNNMFKDITYHTQHLPIVCIHLCVYQLQYDSRKRPFVEYLLRLENNELNFWNKPFFNSVDSNLYEESTVMLKILMAHYGKFLLDDNMFEYTGFHIEGNDVYMFFDVTKTWIAYHLLGMKDPFWTIMTHEIFNNQLVCGYPISFNTRNIFMNHPELVSPIDRNNTPYPLARTGYSLEDKKRLDWVLMIGKYATPIPALGGDYFQFMSNYADCVRGRSTEELKDKIVVRYYLMCDDPINPPEDMVYKEVVEDDEETICYHAMDENGTYILAVRSYYAQTTITAYNAISNDVLELEYVENNEKSDETETKNEAVECV